MALRALHTHRARAVPYCVPARPGGTQQLLSTGLALQARAEVKQQLLAIVHGPCVPGRRVGRPLRFGKRRRGFRQQGFRQRRRGVRPRHGEHSSARHGARHGARREALLGLEQVWLDAARYGAPGTTRAAGCVLPEWAQSSSFVNECMHAPLEGLTRARLRPLRVGGWDRWSMLSMKGPKVTTTAVVSSIRPLRLAFWTSRRAALAASRHRQERSVDATRARLN